MANPFCLEGDIRNSLTVEEAFHSDLILSLVRPEPALFKLPGKWQRMCIRSSARWTTQRGPQTETGRTRNPQSSIGETTRHSTHLIQCRCKAAAGAHPTRCSAARNPPIHGCPPRRSVQPRAGSTLSKPATRRDRDPTNADHQ